MEHSRRCSCAVPRPRLLYLLLLGLLVPMSTFISLSFSKLPFAIAPRPPEPIEAAAEDEVEMPELVEIGSAEQHEPPQLQRWHGDGCNFAGACGGPRLHLVVPLHHRRSRVVSRLARFVRSFQATHPTEELRCTCLMVADVLPPLRLTDGGMDCDLKEARTNASNIDADPLRDVVEGWAGPRVLLRWRWHYSRHSALSRLMVEAARDGDDKPAIIVLASANLLAREGALAQVTQRSRCGVSAFAPRLWVLSPFFPELQFRSDVLEDMLEAGANDVLDGGSWADDHHVVAFCLADLVAAGGWDATIKETMEQKKENAGRHDELLENSAVVEALARNTRLAIHRERSSTFIVLPTAIAQPEAERYVRVWWKDHVTPSGCVHLVSVGQDHRTFPPAADLPEATVPFGFYDLINDPSKKAQLRIFQFNMAVNRDLILDPSILDRVELWLPAGAAGRTAGRPAVIAAESCRPYLPWSTKWNHNQGHLFIDYMIRCAFVVPDSMLADERAVLRDGRFTLFIASETILFPLARVLHFPRPLRILRPPPRPADRFPTAPWRAGQCPGLDVDRLEAGMRRKAPDGRAVVAWVVKKYSWHDNDELWLLWTLDIVGVDHVVINIATADMDVGSVRERLARHPGVSERVTLVELEDVPSGMVAYYSLPQSLIGDAMMRWQVDFEWMLAIDTDEYVQLFDGGTPGSLRRIDAGSFIAQHRWRMERRGQHARLQRYRLRRQQPGWVEDPLVKDVLCAMLALPASTNISAFLADMWDGGFANREVQVKSLFWVPGSLRPWQHWNSDAPVENWDAAQAHALHIREEGDVRHDIARTLEFIAWWKDQHGP